MKDKPQFKIRLSHIIAILISGIVEITICLLLTSCLQSVNAII